MIYSVGMVVMIDILMGLKAQVTVLLVNATENELGLYNVKYANNPEWPPGFANVYFVSDIFLGEL